MIMGFRVSDTDVYGQLQQKERDLILAAELGKALLEKNEELSKQNEKIAEDFSQKLEVQYNTQIQISFIIETLRVHLHIQTVALS